PSFNVVKFSEEVQKVPASEELSIDRISNVLKTIGTPVPLEELKQVDEDEKEDVAVQRIAEVRPGSEKKIRRIIRTVKRVRPSFDVVQFSEEVVKIPVTEELDTKRISTVLEVIGSPMVLKELEAAEKGDEYASDIVPVKAPPATATNNDKKTSKVSKTTKTTKKTVVQEVEEDEESPLDTTAEEESAIQSIIQSHPGSEKRIRRVIRIVKKTQPSFSVMKFSEKIEKEPQSEKLTSERISTVLKSMGAPIPVQELKELDAQEEEEIAIQRIVKSRLGSERRIRRIIRVVKKAQPSFSVSKFSEEISKVPDSEELTSEKISTILKTMGAPGLVDEPESSDDEIEEEFSEVVADIPENEELTTERISTVLKTMGTPVSAKELNALEEVVEVNTTVVKKTEVPPPVKKTAGRSFFQYLTETVGDAANASGAAIGSVFSEGIFTSKATPDESKESGTALSRGFPAEEELDIAGAVEEMRKEYPEAKFNIYEFTNKCQLVAPAFDLQAFLESLAEDTPSSPVMEKRLQLSFEAAGLETTDSERLRLAQTLFGDASSELIHKWAETLRKVGVFEFILGYSDELPEGEGPSIAQAGNAAKALITTICDRGPRMKFDISGFQIACRALNPAFHYDLFLQNLSLEDTGMDKTALKNIFIELTLLKKSGLTLTDAEYESVMDALCGDSEKGLTVMCEWGQYLRIWGQENFNDVIEKTLAEREKTNKLIRSFLGRIYALGGHSQFNLRGFVSACKVRNPKFDLQEFCDTLSNLPQVESDTLDSCFKSSGINVDPDSTEYDDLLITLFGDMGVALAAAREWRHFLRTVGSDWSVFSMWTLLDQRQQVEEAVKQFISEVSDLTDVVTKKSGQRIRFTLRAFIEKCQNLEHSWRSDVDFDLRIFLDKLSALIGEATFTNIVSVLKGCGVNTTADEYKVVIAALASGDYDTSLEIFRRFAVFLKSWGSDWNMWIIWTLLDDKEESEEALQVC
ncbi:hypothetical protein HDU67_010239, partial [Dinochytrium kinnereticum]